MLQEISCVNFDGSLLTCRARFFKDLIYHIFYPLSIPLMMWLDGGIYALINRFFVPAKGSPSGIVFAQLALGCCCKCFRAKSNLSNVKIVESEISFSDVKKEISLFSPFRLLCGRR